MIVEILRLRCEGTEITVYEEGKNKIFISLANDSYAQVYLDHSQTHLLMLYLQEHLGNPVSTIEKKRRITNGYR